MKPRKIAFFGLFGQQNIGNDCTLQAILYHFHRYLPKAEFICSCTGPGEIATRFGIATFPIRSVSSETEIGSTNLLRRFFRKIIIKIPMEIVHWIKSIKALSGAEMLIAPGTGLLVDNMTGPLGFPYYVFKWSLVAKLCRCKLLFVSIGAGPILHPLSRWFIRSALTLADYRSYRDTFSKKYLNNIGFNTDDDPVYPDLAFSLPESIFREYNRRNNGRPVIAVGILDYYGQKDRRNTQKNIRPEVFYNTFLNQLKTFIEWLLNHKYTVRVIIGDVRYDSSVREDLISSIDNNGLKYDSGQLIVEPISTTEELVQQLTKTDFVVSPRYHNIILALMLDKPVISISYNEKFVCLMEETGMGEYFQRIEKLDIDRLIETFLKLEKSWKSLRPHILKKTIEYRKALDKQYSVIFNNIKTASH